MKRWSEFCVSDSFSAASTKSDIQEAWNTKISNDPVLQHWFQRLWLRNECPTVEK
jgi:hypothetical protein